MMPLNRLRSKRSKIVARSGLNGEKIFWLRCDVINGKEKMFCSCCERTGRKNGFTEEQQT